jgi:hypothetical protein
MSLLALLILAFLGQSSTAVRDIDGRTWTPLAPRPGAVHLVFVLGTDCPVSNRYAPEIDRIVASYARRGVRTWFVYPDAATEAAVRANLKAYHAGVTVPSVLDRDQQLTSAMGATITPEVVVYTDRGRVYRGRIDNLYVTLGQARRQATEHDLRNALDAVLAGRPVPRPETQAVGCFVERKTR